MANKGFGLEDVTPSIEILDRINNKDIDDFNADQAHPFIKYDSMKTFIHDTAIVDEGSNWFRLRIWHFTHVSLVQKLSKCVFGSNVYTDNVEIGDNCSTK